MSTASDPAPVESPPPADRPVVREGADLHVRLHRLAGELSTTRDRRCLLEYLRLRRALR